MFKSIQVLLAGVLTMGLVACGGGGGGGPTLDSALADARSKGVNIKLVDMKEYVGDFDEYGNPTGRMFESISLKTVGPTDADLSAAIQSLRAVDALVDGSNIENKDRAHFLIEEAIYDLQQKRKWLAEKENGTNP